LGDKVQRQKGNNPDRTLRSLNYNLVGKVFIRSNKFRVGLEAAFYWRKRFSSLFFAKNL